MTAAIWIIIAVITGVAGYVLATVMSRTSARSRANTIVEDARKEADVLKEKKIIEAKEQEVKIISDAERNANAKMQKAQASEARAKQRELQLNQQQSELGRRKKELEAMKQSLDTRITNAENLERTIEARQGEVEHMYRQAQEQLEHISGLSADEARERLVESLKDEARTAAQGYINDIMDEAKLTANREAKKIVIQSIQRVATETAVENSVTVFHIENDEIKGRIIGREGRNIRALEAATGIEIIVDDTPEAIVLSGFDPVRRKSRASRSISLCLTAESIRPASKRSWLKSESRSKRKSTRRASAPASTSACMACIRN